ncbi:MAG: type IV secretion system protein [Alphaproteobacteria bacterium]|nr:type IV secretion system protein [Alphaproteobacteria bacterium]MBQ7659692.1 type IV secretion system protein [Alphaproteobacteria bacterium]
MAKRLTAKDDVLALEGTRQMAQNYITDEESRLKTFKETYYQWVSRLVMLFCVLSLAFFTSASLVLFKMAPLVRVEPFLIISQDNSDSMVRYEAIAPDMASSRQMMENFIRQYVIMRNTVLNDEREMQSRWFAGGVVNYLSSPSVYIDFKRTQVSELSNLLQKGVVRDVEIISIGKVGGEKSPVWKVDFRTYDLSPSALGTGGNRLVLKTNYWTASVTAFFIKERLFMAKRLMNPLGFTVTRYSQTQVEIL